MSTSLVIIASVIVLYAVALWLALKIKRRVSARRDNMINRGTGIFTLPPKEEE